MDDNSNGVPDECETTFTADSTSALQALIDAASHGDTIELADGVYTDKNLIVVDKTLQIVSTGGPENCIFDLQGTGRAFLIVSLEEENGTRIEGITFQGGYVDHTYPGDGFGGAVYVYASSAKIDRCVFRNNAAFAAGGALFVRGRAGELLLTNVTNSVFYGNIAYGGGAVCVYDHINPAFVNCTFSGNFAADLLGNPNALGGAIAAPGLLQDGVGLFNSIVWGNSPSNSQLHGFWQATSSLLPEEVDDIVLVSGNFSDDPLFVDQNGGDLRLTAGSPAIGMGNNGFLFAAGDLDFEGDDRLIGAGIDVGADEFKP